MEIEDLADRFYALYRGLPRAYGVYQTAHVDTDSGKMQGKARTELGPYSADLWRLHLTGEQGLGVVPIDDDANCTWGAIDVDVYPLDIDELEFKVRRFEFPLLVLRTKSGGAHLTMFMAEAIPAAIIRSRLTEFSMALGYGGVEIFPKQIRLASMIDVGNWLNMPYFDAHKTTRYAVSRGSVLSVEDFLDLAEESRISARQLAEISISLSEYFADGPPCLQVLATNGIPEGQRNNALFAIGVYTRMKYEDDWEKHLDVLNGEIMEPPLPSREVQMIVRSLSKKTYYYPCSKAPICNVCNKQVCKKREFGIGDLGGNDFDISIGSLVKIQTDPPTWIIDVEGVRMELETDDLLNQERFRRLCVSAINKLPSKLKPIAWEKLIRDKLENVEVQQAPQESSVRGRLHFYVEQYLINTPPAKYRDELLIAKPWTDSEKGIVYFRGNDLIRYLETQSLRPDPRLVWKTLRDMGAGHDQFNIKGRNVQVWTIAFDNYQQESFTQEETPRAEF